MWSLSCHKACGSTWKRRNLSGSFILSRSEQNSQHRTLFISHMIGIDVFKLPFVGENAHVPRDSKSWELLTYGQEIGTQNWKDLLQVTLLEGMVNPEWKGVFDLIDTIKEIAGRAHTWASPFNLVDRRQKNYTHPLLPQGKVVDCRQGGSTLGSWVQNWNATLFSQWTFILRVKS